MAETASDVLVNILEDWGVDTVFGLPGDGVNGVIEAFRKRQDRIRFIHVRHEEAAAFAASSYAKHTGRLGVCVATSGPGAIHLLNGLYDAKMDQQPVLAITGMQFHDLTNTFTQQDVEVDKLFMDVAGYNVRIMGPNHVEPAMELACRYALSNRAVSSVTIPVDFQEMSPRRQERSKRNVEGHSRACDISAHLERPPAHDSLERAAQVLNAGSKIVILAGRGALHCTDELEQLAEKLGAPIVKPLLGKAAVPDDSPYTTGGIGLLGTKPSQEAIEDCDTLFLIGTSFPYIEFLPKPGQARAVQLDINPARIGLRYPVDVGLVGDTRSGLRGLLPLLKRNENRSFLQQAQAGMRDWWKLMDKRASVRSTPMKPELLAKEISSRLHNDAIVNCDSGTITTWWARHILAKRGQMHTVSGTLASMACGVSYAIGAQAAYPNRQVVAFVGDGSASMLMGEFATAVQNRLPIKIFIVKNNSLGQIRWEQIVFLGNPEFACDLSPINFAEVARACGAQGFSIENPDSCGAIVEQALNAPGPAVVEALVDTNEPPMPAQVKPEQAIHFAEALARGTRDAHKIIGTVLEDRIRELV